MKNYAVIGSQYGDESKGKTVDYIAKSIIGQNILTIRYSGSNNAGHTVVMQDGRKHVFSSLGSASFRGSYTYLYKNFTVDLVAIAKEVLDFSVTNGYHYDKTIYIDPRCRICILYDVVLNRLKEYKLKDNKHGSTGCGLNESIKRNEYYPLTMSNYDDRENYVKAYNYFMAELEKLDINIDEISIESLKTLTLNCIDEQSIDIIYNNVKNVITLNDYISVSIPNLNEYSCIFESSQGLLLDEYYGTFPHVTRSKVGSHTLIDICREFNIEIDQVYYVMRPYFSRHGQDANFNKNNHDQILSEMNIIDKTNVHNDWQGSVSYDYIDLLKVRDVIEKDSDLMKKHYSNTQHVISLSCCDQVDKEKYKYYIGDDLYHRDFNINIFKNYFNMPIVSSYKEYNV